MFSSAEIPTGRVGITHDVQNEDLSTYFFGSGPRESMFVIETDVERIVSEDFMMYEVYNWND